MVHINVNKPDNRVAPGIDLWEIKECEAVRSTAGDQMLKIKFSLVSDNSEHTIDRIMLEGKGWFYGKQKLVPLVGEDFDGDLDPLSLIGTRLWLEIVSESYKDKQGNTKQSLKVGGTQLKHQGYQHMNQVPPGKTLPEPVDDQAPF